MKWVDPHSVDEWTVIDDIDTSVKIIDSFGYEIHRDNEVTVISSTVDFEDDKTCCALVIPNCCIKEYKYVES